jgi:hypothetical protein
VRVVADTLVSAFLWSGAPAEVLTATRDQDLRTLDPFRTIRILPAREALALLSERRG